MQNGDLFMQFYKNLHIHTVILFFVTVYIIMYMY